jgi:hypothetical protein
MKNIKLQKIISNKITEFNNYIINKFSQIKAIKKKFSKIDHLRNKFNQISNFNKFLIFFISTLFLYLFYVSTPSLYDYQRLQNQLTTHLLNEYNLNVNISDKIKYKILPSPHFEVKESTIYSDIESDENKLGEIKNIKIFASIINIYNQDKLKLQDIEIKESIFYLNRENQRFIFNYFKNKNTDKKISIKKSKFFLMDKDEIISIFPIKDLNFEYNKKLFINEVTLNGKAFNSYFNLNITKDFLENEQLNFILKFPQINLSIESKMLSQKNKKKDYKVFNKINFIGSEINLVFEVDKNFLIYKSLKSKVFNNEIDFSGIIELHPFYLKSKIILDEINLNKLLNNNESIFRLLSKKTLIHKNFNSKILLDVKKFSKNDIFDSANFSIEVQNGIIKFDESVLISKKIGSLKILSGDLYNSNNKIYLNSKIRIDVQNQKKFYNILQVPKIFRTKIETFTFDFLTNLTLGTTEIVKFKINNIVSKNLTQKINNIIKDNNIDINKNFNNWIIFRRLINIVIFKVNEE